MTNKEFEKIYNDAYKAVYWTAWQLLKNEADAEDVVQDTFVSFIESYIVIVALYFVHLGLVIVPYAIIASKDSTIIVYGWAHVWEKEIINIFIYCQAY